MQPTQHQLQETLPPRCRLLQQAGSRFSSFMAREIRDFLQFFSCFGCLLLYSFGKGGKGVPNIHRLQFSVKFWLSLSAESLAKATWILDAYTHHASAIFMQFRYLRNQGYSLHILRSLQTFNGSRFGNSTLNDMV